MPADERGDAIGTRRNPHKFGSVSVVCYNTKVRKKEQTKQQRVSVVLNHRCEIAHASKLQVPISSMPDLPTDVGA